MAIDPKDKIVLVLQLHPSFVKSNLQPNAKLPWP